MIVVVVSQGAVVSSTSDAKSLLPHPVGLVLGELRTPKLGARPTIINVPPTAPHQPDAQIPVRNKLSKRLTR